jgi:hypothetical protein
MGNTSLTAADVFSAANNQAGLAWLEHAEFGLSAQQYFGFTDLNNLSGAAALPLKNSAFGISAYYLGDANFNQSKVGLGYGRKLGEEVSVGVQINYCNTRVNEFGSANAFTFEAGIQYLPSDQLIIAGRVFNPILVSPGEPFSEEELPGLFALGIEYRPAEKLSLVAEAEQNLTEGTNVKLGVEYQMIPQLQLRGGYMSASRQFTCGIGVVTKALYLDGGIQYHQLLGLSPSFGVRYRFGT